MSGALTIRNRQRTRRVELACVRQVAKAALQDLLELEAFDLGLYLVGAAEMTHLNETFLRHGGSTDVITFDYTEPKGRGHKSRDQRGKAAEGGSQQGSDLHGEIFICVDDAVAQARRFRSSWESELARYLVHGLLHLRGYDDRRPPARRRMKREEDRLLRLLASRFDLSGLAARKSR